MTFDGVRGRGEEGEEAVIRDWEGGEAVGLGRDEALTRDGEGDEAVTRDWEGEEAVIRDWEGGEAVTRDLEGGEAVTRDWKGKKK